MNKIEITSRCKEILYSYNIKEILNSDDERWIIDNVFCHHPEWDWWLNQGIKNILVGMKSNDIWTTRCFYVHFINPIDKNTCEISYTKSIKNIKQNR